MTIDPSSLDGTDLNDLASGTWQGTDKPELPRELEPEQLPDGSGLSELDSETADLEA